MKLNSDHEVRLDLSGVDYKNSVSGNHPNINNTDDVHLHHDSDDSGLRPRKKVAAKTNLIEPAFPTYKVNATANSPSEIIEIETAASHPVTPRTPLLASLDSEVNDDDENGHSPTPKRPARTVNIYTCFIAELFYLVFIMLALILGASMNKLEVKIRNLELWKWCVLGLPILGGHLVSKCIVFLIFRDSFYFVPLKSLTSFIWICLVNIIWWFVMNKDAIFSIDTAKALKKITWWFFCVYIVAGVWIIRASVIKLLFALFYDNRFSKRIQESYFHQYILQTLSGLSEVHSSSSSSVSCSGSNVIDAQKPTNIIKLRMIETASRRGFYTLPNKLDESKDLMMNPDEQYSNRYITNEREAKGVGDLIFGNVAKRGHVYIEKEDLLRFMIKEEVDMVLPLIVGVEESGRINEKSFIKWVVNMYMKSKFLDHSLDDLNKALNTLFMFVNVILALVLIILWVILMGIATTEVLLFILSQFLLAIFTFGSSAKSTFDAMIFVFLKHPFDVGDRCVVDGVQVVVEELSILTTIFLNYDNEKVYYPNSILATKSIRNLNRSPEMRDNVGFDLNVSTSVETISDIKANIKTYIDSKPHLWQPKHSVRVVEISDVNKMKMRLYVTHTLKVPDYEEKCDRRSNLVLELRNIFQQLGITNYQILPPTNS